VPNGIHTTATVGSAQALAWDLWVDAQSDEEWEEEYKDSWESQRAKYKWELSEIRRRFPDGVTPQVRSMMACMDQEFRVNRNWGLQGFTDVEKEAVREAKWEEFHG
jgi:hypothetical protein